MGHIFSDMLIILDDIMSSRLSQGSAACARWWVRLLLIGWVGVLGLASLAQAQSIEFPLDFESGDLRGWRASGDAFQHQPTLGDNPTARDRGQPSGHHGRWWIGTFERYQARAGQSAGDSQGDDPQGTLTSAHFVVPAGSLSFLVGGGAAPQTRVELWVVGEGGDPEFNQDRVYANSGENSESMHEVTWDLTRYVGKEAFIRIVDASSGGWGHINVDYFRIVPQLTVVQPINGRLINPGVVARITPAVVPPVTNMSLAQAEATLREAALVTGDIILAEPEYLDGPVIQQRPQPNTRVERGSRVNLWLAAPPRVRVPRVTGMSVPVAARTLEANNLRLGQRHTQASEAQASGTVLVQEPPPGTTVRANSLVSLVVAVPNIVGVAVPNLNGLTPLAAERILANARLALGQVTPRESERPENTVFTQNPRAGQEVRTGTTVNVVVATAQYVEVPEVVDRQQDDARARLARARLRLGAVEHNQSSHQPGTVLAQEPHPDSRVRVGSAVNITVAVAIPLVPAIDRVVVPDATGLSRPSANKRLLGARLVPGEVIEEASDRTSGTVVRQQPPAGARVAPGTAVTVWVATAKTLRPSWIVVPLIVFFGIGGGYWLRARSKGMEKGRAPIPDSGLVITPWADPGSACIDCDHPSDLAMEVRFTPVADAGTQQLESPDALIDTESKDS